MLLHNLRQKLNFHALVSTFTFLYNGHGVVYTDETLKDLSGSWICDHGELMYIEEVVAEVVKKAREQKSKIHLKVISDACGSSGALHRLLVKLTDSKLNLCDELLEITLFCPCEWDENSFGNARGGFFTEYVCRTEENFKEVLE